MKVVVVEDDVLLARHYARMLRRENCEVFHAEHAREAIDTIDDVMPDVILADMLLTGSTVVPLLHELRSHHDLARIPVVLITNITEHLNLSVLAPYGVVRLLDKSTMEPEDLMAAIRGSVV